MFKVKMLILSSLLLPKLSFATVGGPQNIEVLGYESKEQKVYLLRHYQDGRGRLPQLYYYQFKNNPHPEKIIQVNSLYINPKTQKIDYDQPSTQFNKDLQKIKKRLQPLLALPKQNIQIRIMSKKVSKEKSWYDSEQYIAKYSYKYQLKSQNFNSKIYRAVAYRNGLTLSQAYKIPHQQKKLAIVRYLGIPFETGYTVEDPVLLHLPSPKK